MFSKLAHGRQGAEWTSPARAAISALTEPRRRSLAHEHQRKSTTGAVASALPASAPAGAPPARGPRPDGRPLRADVAPTRAARHRPDPALTSPRRASPARADVAPAGIRRREHCRPDGRPLRARASPRRAFHGANVAATGAPRARAACVSPRRDRTLRRRASLARADAAPVGVPRAVDVAPTGYSRARMSPHCQSCLGGTTSARPVRGARPCPPSRRHVVVSGSQVP